MKDDFNPIFESILLFDCYAEGGIYGCGAYLPRRYFLDEIAYPTREIIRGCSNGN